jgi:NAD(P)-dependent dehydrogenase (short-subunit alcohol dehydrogenase family)
MSDVHGVRVLISGGTSGLGRAMAAALAAGGARVVLTGRDPGRAAAVAAELHASSPGDVVGVGMDVRDESAVVSGVAAARAALSGIDVLVNNAGIGMRSVNPRFLEQTQPFWEVPTGGFADLFTTNVTGYFLLARAVAPEMVARGTGRIVNVSINEATMRRAGFTPYGPSRAATDALSHVMAADLAGTGVTVNLLAPGGATATGMVPSDISTELRAGLLDPEIMGPAVCWLASCDSDGVTDQKIIATEFA